MSETLSNAQPARLAPPWDDKKVGFPRNINVVREQRDNQQIEIQEAHWDARSKCKLPVCGQVLNISLFFDGTNNHLDSELKASPPNPTNIGRLYMASIGSNENTRKKAQENGYYAYYMQGVGTRFKEIGERVPDSAGLAFATGGHKRINWGFTRLVDALRLATSSQVEHMKDAEAEKLAEGMIYQKPLGHEQNRAQSAPRAPADNDWRKRVLSKALDSVARRINEGRLPKVLYMKLHIYGFSRGAAQARTFVRWLYDLCEHKEGRHYFFEVPIKVQFLGMMDTVTSVGNTPLVGNALGHWDWANGTLALPDDASFIINHVHLVSAHEQRLCFPLDSVRLASGNYPAVGKKEEEEKEGEEEKKGEEEKEGFLGEWVYPGMHSDVGGGYQNGEQGKAVGNEQGMMLSQIPLLRMYNFAFKANAPLLLNKSDFEGADTTGIESWRWMGSGVVPFFFLSPVLKERFNAWATFSASFCGDVPLEEIMINQTAQITAWRIERYAGGLTEKCASISPADFYHQAQDTPAWKANAQSKAWQQRTEAQAQYDEHQDLIDNPNAYTHAKARAEKQQAELQLNGPMTISNPENPKETDSYTPNIDKAYESQQDKMQLKNAMAEFKEDYRQIPISMIKDDLHPKPCNAAEAAAVRNWSLVGVMVRIFLLPGRLFSRSHGFEPKVIIEQGNALYPRVIKEKNLMALYDNHVHDTRAWFMVNTTQMREAFGSYFTYRLVIVDPKTSKDKYTEEKLAQACKAHNDELDRLLDIAHRQRAERRNQINGLFNETPPPPMNRTGTPPAPNGDSAI